MLQHILTAWRSGWRSRSFQALFFIGLISMVGVFFSASFSGRHPETVALDVGISVSRFLILLMALFWCQELVGKEIDRKTIFTPLAYPTPRYSYLLGRFLGIALLTAVALVIMTALVAATVWLAKPANYVQAHPILMTKLPLVMLYVYLDILVVLAFTFLIAALSTTPMLPLGLGVCFAIAARSFGPALDYVLNAPDRNLELAARYGPLLDLLRWFLPDLSRMDIRVITLYGADLSYSALLFPVLMCFAYTLILLLLAISYFNRREFV